MGGIVTAHSARVAGDEMNDAIVAMFRKEFNLDIGDNTAEEVKIQIGSAWPLAEEITADVGGRDVDTGLPRTQAITTNDVRTALDEPVTAIIDAIKMTLERTPPELAADIIGQGLVLSGGGSLLAGLAERTTFETGIHSYLAPEPLYSVVLGAGLTLDNIEAMRGLTAQTVLE
jgi:rod shape-determining protein MreB